MSVRVKLAELAYARSGDKGDVCNVGVMAKTPAIYRALEALLTPERIATYFAGVVQGPVEVYRLPNLDSFNLVLRRALGGGATRTLRFDQTGKSMAAAALRMELEVDESLAAEARQATARIEKRRTP
jgi:hypothetical protein